MNNRFSAHPGDDTLLDLASGYAVPETQQWLLAHLHACAACENRFRDVAASHVRAEADAAERFGAARHGASRPWARRATWGLAAAGLAAVAAVGVWSVHQGDRPAAAEPIYRLPDAEPRSAIRAFGALPADSVVLAGLAAYKANDLAAARRLLETDGASDAMNDVRRIYLGATLLELGDAEAALAALRPLRFHRVPEPWKSESRWSMALALARTGDVRAADSMFVVLGREPGPVAERARARLRAPLRAQ